MQGVVDCHNPFFPIWGNAMAKKCTAFSGLALYNYFVETTALLGGA